MCKVSAPYPFPEVGGSPDKVVIFEVQQTRDSFGKWLVKLKIQSYIALVVERNVTLRGGAVGSEIEQQHQIAR